MNIKNDLALLSEMAASDIKLNTKNVSRADTIHEVYSSIPEIEEPVVTEACDVVITETANNNYYVEMVNLAPFMLDSGIKSISKALDMVAEANNLPVKSLGLVVESQENVDNAISKAKSNVNPKVLESTLNKLNKNNIAINHLLREGYKVAKKSKDSKVCPKCGKATCKCECTGKKN